MNLTKIKQEIEEQTRNGRKEIYLKVSDLKELGYNIDTAEDRVFVKEEDILYLYQNKINENING